MKKFYKAIDDFANACYAEGVILRGIEVSENTAQVDPMYTSYQTPYSEVKIIKV